MRLILHAERAVPFFARKQWTAARASFTHKRALAIVAKNGSCRSLPF
jgi:hypothetical protein